MMSKIGYARVSTRDQNLDSQIDTLKDYGCERIFAELEENLLNERTKKGIDATRVRSGVDQKHQKVRIRFCSPCYDSKGYITNRILKITRLYKGTIYSQRNAFIKLSILQVTVQRGIIGSFFKMKYIIIKPVTSV